MVHLSSATAPLQKGPRPHRHLGLHLLPIMHPTIILNLKRPLLLLRPTAGPTIGNLLLRAHGHNCNGALCTQRSGMLASASMCPDPGICNDIRDVLVNCNFIYVYTWSRKAATLTMHCVPVRAIA